MKYYVRKIYAQNTWAVLNGRGERISVHTTQERAEQAKKHYEETARERETALAMRKNGI